MQRLVAAGGPVNHHRNDEYAHFNPVKHRFQFMFGGVFYGRLADDVEEHMMDFGERS